MIEILAGSKDIELTLYLRHARKLHGKTPASAKVVEGDVLDGAALDAAVVGQDVVYANLTGDDLEAQAKSIVESVQGTEVSRRSVGALVVECIRKPAKFMHQNLGVNEPNTDGDKPSFY